MRTFTLSAIVGAAVAGLLAGAMIHDTLAQTTTPEGRRTDSVLLRPTGAASQDALTTGRLALEQGQPKKALRILEKAYVNPDLEYLKARSLYGMGDTEGARRAADLWYEAMNVRPREELDAALRIIAKLDLESERKDREEWKRFEASVDQVQDSALRDNIKDSDDPCVEPTVGCGGCRQQFKAALRQAKESVQEQAPAFAVPSQ